MFYHVFLFLRYQSLLKPACEKDGKEREIEKGGDGKKEGIITVLRIHLPLFDIVENSLLLVVTVVYCGGTVMTNVTSKRENKTKQNKTVTKYLDVSSANEGLVYLFMCSLTVQITLLEGLHMTFTTVHTRYLLLNSSN